MRKRAVWVEPLFAEAKEWHGFQRFRLRGLEKVNSEALMIASGQNVKRLVAFGPKGPRRAAACAALRQPEAGRSGFRGVREHRREGVWPPAGPFSTGWGAIGNSSFVGIYRSWSRGVVDGGTPYPS